MWIWVWRGIILGGLLWFMPWDASDPGSTSDLRDCERSHEC